MKRVENMTPQERVDCFDDLQLFIESAVESEQIEPAPFKLETEKRIDLVLINLREMLGLPKNETSEKR